MLAKIRDKCCIWSIGTILHLFIYFCSCGPSTYTLCVIPRYAETFTSLYIFFTIAAACELVVQFTYQTIDFWYWHTNQVKFHQYIKYAFLPITAFAVCNIVLSIKLTDEGYYVKYGIMVGGRAAVSILSIILNWSIYNDQCKQMERAQNSQNRYAIGEPNHVIFVREREHVPIAGE